VSRRAQRTWKQGTSERRRFPGYLTIATFPKNLPGAPKTSGDRSRRCLDWPRAYLSKKGQDCTRSSSISANPISQQLATVARPLLLFLLAFGGSFRHFDVPVALDTHRLPVSLFEL